MDTLATDTADFVLVLRENSEEFTFGLARGESTVGHAAECKISTPIGTIDLAHAVIRVADGLTIEDLGSRTGTWIKGSRLMPNQPVSISVGEFFQLGSLTAVVVPAPAGPKRRLLAAPEFAERLHEESCRSSRSGGGFALCRISLNEPRPFVAQLFFDVLRVYDVVGQISETQFSLLIIETSPGEAEIAARRVSSALSQVSVDHETALVCFGRDGRLPELLTARAEAMLRGEPAVTSGTPVPFAPYSAGALDTVIHQVAAGTISVMITGETGVGKDVLAESIHRRSPRATKPFLRLNCAALTPTLLESELFGHERGAFTGAVQTKPGLLETAHGGTVFLDEIGELSLSSQVKLLRVVEERRVLRVGGLRAHAIDVRFISATNRDLEAEMSGGTFRRDLFYRLSGIALHVEPLRKRSTEITPLALRFIAEAWPSREQPPPGLSQEAQRLLETYPWPGNIRELRNVMERAVLLCGTNGLILPTHLRLTAPRASAPASPPPMMAQHIAFQPTPPPPSPPHESPLSPPQGLGSPPLIGDPMDERGRMLDALKLTGGNQTRAAELLGISRRTFVHRMGMYGLPRPRKPS